MQKSRKNIVEYLGKVEREIYFDINTDHLAILKHREAILHESNSASFASAIKVHKAVSILEKEVPRDFFRVVNDYNVYYKGDREKSLAGKHFNSDFLSSRQLNCINAAFRLLGIGNVGASFHELYDFMDNYGLSVDLAFSDIEVLLITNWITLYKAVIQSIGIESFLDIEAEKVPEMETANV